ncbi:hypothetical protein BJY04DRAFT_31869 [Aspergillus karnatakaensis]|uniref:uncharacterized protein n=1 Tax=Aspergillus karnatakaensis TaxID=1810916 RepID=UPI003CCD601E
MCTCPVHPILVYCNSDLALLFARAQAQGCELLPFSWAILSEVPSITQPRNEKCFIQPMFAPALKLLFWAGAMLYKNLGYQGFQALGDSGVKIQQDLK